MPVDMAITTKSSRILTWLAAWQDEQMSGFDTIWNTVKVYTAEACVENALNGRQVFRGYGYIKDISTPKAEVKRLCFQPVF